MRHPFLNTGPYAGRSRQTVDFDGMRTDVPPAGPNLDFRTWTETLARYLRAYVPEVLAVRSGPRRTTLRYGDRNVSLIQDGSIYWIRFNSEADVVPMASLFDGQRHDDFTARNFAKTIAGFFDARHSTAN